MGIQSASAHSSVPARPLGMEASVPRVAVGGGCVVCVVVEVVGAAVGSGVSPTGGHASFVHWYK